MFLGYRNSSNFDMTEHKNIEIFNDKNLLETFIGKYYFSDKDYIIENYKPASIRSCGMYFNFLFLITY